MGTSLEEIQQILADSADQALDVAIASLDQKLAEYAAAVRQLAGSAARGDVAPAGQAETPLSAPDVSADISQDDSPEVSPETMADAQASSSQTGLAADDESAAVGAAAEPVAEMEAARGPADETAAGAQEVKRPGAYRLTERGSKANRGERASAAAERPAVVEPEVPAEPADGPAAMSEEEALLASLDEATAKAVRVLRRLNPKKPLAELVQQAQSHAHEQASKQGNKTWFRFGR